MSILDTFEAIEIARPKDEGGTRSIGTVSRYTSPTGFRGRVEQEAITRIVYQPQWEKVLPATYPLVPPIRMIGGAFMRLATELTRLRLKSLS